MAPSAQVLGRHALVALVLVVTVAACGGGTSTNTVRHGDRNGPSVEAGPDGSDLDASNPDPGSDGDAVEAGPVAVSDAPTTACEGDAIFADPAVEAAARAAAGRPSGVLSAGDLASVTQLTVSGAASLSGVECLSNLEGLVAPDGSFGDLSPLRGLQHLTSVLVERSGVRDLTPLSDLPSIRSIRASDNRISSLRGLSLPEAACNYVLDVQRNPLSQSDTRPFCDLGWIVTWSGADAGAVEQCNSSCL